MGKRKTQERKKVSLVFDVNKRKEFLCGFRKRKLERKKKAQEELQQLLKAEKKRIKQENKESYKKLVVSSRPIPDIEQLLQEEYEDEDVNVKIVELSSDILQKKDLVIGENKAKETNKNKEVNKIKKCNEIVVPGMGSDIESSAENNLSDLEDKDSKLKTKKQIKKLLKKQATKKIKQSKVYQMKGKLERIKNKKKSNRKNGQIIKEKQKHSGKRKVGKNKK